MASARGALEALYDGLVGARDDIRQKVVEEPWFGRAVTPEAVGTAPEAAPGKDTLAEFYDTQVSRPPERGQEPEISLER
jgi:hypothetical protein